jgi:lipopolysaccharide transport system ATP-binding protein
VKRGEVVGIIGRNGAGKSTLLKILSRITTPTEGEVEIKGRVGSLLEVGTGFHPELTGRENIYLNGAILGMKRAEINRKFDEIVAFAEIEKFIDTPVKRYSSGMYVRLAFAVAAHLDPEILLVDEVLAVGDAQFQKKCLGKIGEVAKEGRTVLFVSHNMAAVRGLCDKGFLLSGGDLAIEGETDFVVRSYLRNGNRDKTTASWHYLNRGKVIKLESVEVLVDGKVTNHIQAGDNVAIVVRYKCVSENIPRANLSVSITIFADDRKVTNLWTNYHRDVAVSVQRTGFVKCEIPRWVFREVSVRFDVWMMVGNEVQDWIENAACVESHDGDFYKSGVITASNQGSLFLEHRWLSNSASAG